jgi:hypothetical protein
MTDEQFIAQFEDCTLPAEGFHHREHVKIVWLYLRRYPLLETLTRFSESLKRFATSHGKPNLYHETITWAYALLINERMERSGRAESWEEFAARNADLFDWKNSVLNSYYREETLRSEQARKSFVFPDKLLPLPESADASSGLSAPATEVSLGVSQKD